MLPLNLEFKICKTALSEVLGPYQQQNTYTDCYEYKTSPKFPTGRLFNLIIHIATYVGAIFGAHNAIVGGMLGLINDCPFDHVAKTIVLGTALFLLCREICVLTRNIEILDFHLKINFIRGLLGSNQVDNQISYWQQRTVDTYVLKHIWF